MASSTPLKNHWQTNNPHFDSTNKFENTEISTQSRFSAHPTTTHTHTAHVYPFDSDRSFSRLPGSWLVGLFAVDKVQTQHSVIGTAMQQKQFELEMNGIGNLFIFSSEQHIERDTYCVNTILQKHVPHKHTHMQYRLHHGHDTTDENLNQ